MICAATVAMTKDEALALYATGFWVTMSYRDRAMFQLFERLLCMPWAVFHEAVEKTLGRPVDKYELGPGRERLRQELLGEAPPPSVQDIMDMIPERLTIYRKR